MEKIKDLDYLDLLITQLKTLEELVYARNERLRLFYEKIQGIRAIIAGVMATIFPLVIWFYLLVSEHRLLSWETASEVGIVLSSLLVLNAFLFIATYLFLQQVGKRPLVYRFSKPFEKHELVSLHTDLEKIDEVVSKLISQDIFQASRVPDAYLTFGYLAMLENYLKNDTVRSLKEALDLMIADLGNQKNGSEMASSQTLIRKEIDYLSHKKQHRLEDEEVFYCVN